MSAPNRSLGPCGVLWDLAGVNIELNPTFGGVKFKDDLQIADIKEDGQGETPVDAVTIGRITEITVPMTNSSLAQLEAAIHGSVAGIGNLKVSNDVGVELFALSKEVILKRLVKNVPSVTTTEWLHIHKCYPIAQLEWTYDNAGQRVTNVVFKVFPDTATGRVGEVWRMGPA